MLNKFQGVPWEPIPGREGVDIKSHVGIGMREDDPMRIPEPVQREVIMMRAKITKGDITKYGGTPGCHGCIAANRGITRDHSETCRKRMEGFMARHGDTMLEKYEERLVKESERIIRKS